MSILKHVSLTKKDVRFPDEIPPTAVQSLVHDRGPMSNEFPYRNEYRMEVTAYQVFQASPTDLQRATETARHAICQTFYADILRHLPHLRLCLMGRDWRGAMELVDAIEAETKP